MTQYERGRWWAAGVVAVGLAAAAATTAIASAGTAPPVAGNETVRTTIKVTGVFDGANKQFVGSGALGDGGQDENQKPLFELADGAVLENVIIGAPAADGVHCTGSCTLRNVFWEDVGEDAATFRGSNATVRIIGGGAANADDKIFQDNRAGGGSVTIRDFQVDDAFGKLYRSCGNCRTQAARSVILSNITVTGRGGVLVGINTNLGDTAKLDGIRFTGVGKAGLCDLFEGNDTGREPKKIGSGPNNTTCVATNVRGG
ncbi:pectate lyase [Micromonospora sp. KC606]|uniref:pectate lyase n=1 Tax=Micromonospora sp. KC606 TaxID=2530379 RepID=UPI0010500699|nr:pectate lyase [Micromonospora sp. KC606]TDC78569.1 pectate lyase [Micromonospora sp. KC606]